ncbi:9504_t:CDS:1, partial [Funneliformis geosporum]
NNPQKKENIHPISGSLEPFHETIEMNVQEKQKKKKKRSLQDQLKSIQ